MISRLLLSAFVAVSLVGLSHAATPENASAGQWTIQRIEGRDYVPLKDISRFYKLSEPAVVQGPTFDTGSVEPQKIVRTGGERKDMEFTSRSRRATINGVHQWLAFPPVWQNDQLYISRLDLSKVIEPRMRPEMIAGFGPVKTIVLDPGHGGHDRGARSRHGFEKDFTLDIALRMRPMLERAGYKVILTRATDIFVPLHDRPKVANNEPDSIFVSIHFNSGANTDARGFEIFSIAPRGAPSTNSPKPTLQDLRADPGHSAELPSSALAGSLYHALLGHIPNVDRGIKHARFAVLRHCHVPAVLVECGFVSNSRESALISTKAWREQLARALVDGIDDFKGLAEKGRTPKNFVDYRQSSTAAPEIAR